MRIKQKIKRDILYWPFAGKLYLYKTWGRPGGVPLPAARSCNSVLKTKKEWSEARSEAIKLGLKPYKDEPKNWDALAAVKYILENTTKDASILDAGAEIYSVILPWLYKYGYTNLTGINLVFSKTLNIGPIKYKYGDITSTEFQNDSFDAITCMSVIEHGVNIQSYLDEMFRILKPGGILITSTDYYENSIDTQGKYAYEVPVHIFSRNEIEEAVKYAESIGFELTENLDYSCREKAVTWPRLGLEYTFIIFTIKKRELQ